MEFQRLGFSQVLEIPREGVLLNYPEPAPDPLTNKIYGLALPVHARDFVSSPTRGELGRPTIVVTSTVDILGLRPEDPFRNVSTSCGLGGILSSVTEGGRHNTAARFSRPSKLKDRMLAGFVGNFGIV